MKIGRNDLCPCGSGKKYKQCCLRKNVMTEYELIKKVTAQEGYEPLVSDFICNLYHYMKKSNGVALVMPRVLYCLSVSRN